MILFGNQEECHNILINTKEEIKEQITNNGDNKDNSNNNSCSNNNINNTGRNQEEYDKMKEEMEGRINRLRAEHSEKVMQTF